MPASYHGWERGLQLRGLRPPSPHPLSVFPGLLRKPFDVLCDRRKLRVIALAAETLDGEESVSVPIVHDNVPGDCIE